MQEINFHRDILPLKDKLFRLALRIMPHRAEAEDVVQDVLVRVWEQRNDWHKLESVEAWCITAVRNLAIDRLRRSGHAVPSEAETAEKPDAAHNPHERMEHGERMTLIAQLMDELPETQRTIMHLRDVEDKSYKEIAAALGLSEEQVKVYLFRARQRVKKRYLEIESYGL